MEKARQFRGKDDFDVNKEIPLKQIIDAALSKIGSVADVNTVIGDPIKLPEGVTVIPFSKVSVGFASGGAEYGGLKPDEKTPSIPHSPNFAGGNGAGVSVTPMGFLVIDKTGVRMLDLKRGDAYTPDPVAKVMNSIDSLIDRAPDLAKKVKNTFKKDKKESTLDEDIEEAVTKAVEEE